MIHVVPIFIYSFKVVLLYFLHKYTNGVISLYYTYAGHGHMQGGAWCNSAKTCQLTKSSGRGSSDHMDKEIPFTGIMSSSSAVNPGLPVHPQFQHLILD